VFSVGKVDFFSRAHQNYERPENAVEQLMYTAGRFDGVKILKQLLGKFLVC